MIVDISVPKSGMSMTEATLAAWLVEVGQDVAKGDEVAEVVTDKVDMTVVAPVAGVLVEKLIAVEEDFSVPGVIGRIEAKHTSDPKRIS